MKTARTGFAHRLQLPVKLWANQQATGEARKRSNPVATAASATMFP
ncbi:hypothetical protein [Amycolatopsis sp. DSM 110486]|nr:hypothetical protein [Amycolatopsis sp. DSM 110486]QYN18902.1 hypothetical protein K1T34_40380 [Amycolatopsis sp. DSM 110486]